MAPTKYKCPKAGSTGCDWEEELDPMVASVYIQSHLDDAHPKTERAKPPKLPMPKLAAQVSPDVFEEFRQEWLNWKTSSSVETGKESGYLLQCCEVSLKMEIQASTTNAMAKPEVELMELLKKHAVVTRAKCAMVTDLLNIRQSEEEPVRKFKSRIDAVARNCGLDVACTHTCCAAKAKISFADVVAKHVLINGIHDVEIRKEVLGTAGLDDKSLMETVGIVENKETALRSMPEYRSTGKADALSGYRKSTKIEKSDPRLQQKGKCETCKKEFKNRQLRTSKNKPDEIKTFKLCYDCWTESRKKLKKDGAKGKSGARDGSDESSAITDGVHEGFLAVSCKVPVCVPGPSRDAAVVNDSFLAVEAVTHGDRQTAGRRSTPKTYAASCKVPVCVPGHSQDAAVETGWQIVSRRRHGNRRSGRQQTPAIMASTAEAAIPPMMWDPDQGWTHKAEGHGKISLTAFTREEDLRKFGIRHRQVRPTVVSVVADSGCQSPIMGLSALYRLGLNKSDLARIRATATSISGQKIEIIGIVVLRFSGRDKVSGKTVETAGQVRVAADVRDIYISKSMMIDLGILSKDFPSIRVGDDQKAATMAACKTPPAGDRAPCGCLRRTGPPPPPETLPFEPVEKNVGKMKEYLLDAYASSAFNKCPHEPLPMMKCAPIRIHVKEDAKPVACKTASTVPLHLREAVKAQLEEDVALGTIERVPIGVETTWQARMHVVTKPDGTPRRTVDLRHLNDHCIRETEHIVPPYKQARLIPAGVWKTKTDAWNGYHSCPLDKRDRHLTTFITEWGRFRNLVAPQGFMASGDGYNQRYGRLVEDMPRTTRCVDDLALWDSDMEEHWWRTIRYLDRIARNGIIISPAKFEFCAREIEFAGFRVTWNGVKPLARYLDAVAKFPRPTNITDIRSFFGLINQLAHYAQLRDMMAPFKPFLSPRTRFQWTDELEELFIRAKKEIVEAIKEGVEIFEPERTTVLSTDWSKQGIGYFLYQKHCDCPSRVTTCCEHGWRVTLAGSRALTSAEANYWPTEGEALAVCWALEDSKFFTLGCNDLAIQTDHKPLVKLLGDRTLDEIQNRRLVNLKEKTFPWKFDIHWVAGKSIPAPDATSRHPQKRADADTVDLAAAAMDAIRMDDSEAEDLAGDYELAAGADGRLRQFRAVTWEVVKEETAADRDMQVLTKIIADGFHCRLDDLSPAIAKFWQYRETLYVVDGVVMYGDRVVIPARLRKEVLDNLHGAHQGTSQMLARASTTVFWPGISVDVQRVRDECEACGRMAPSQRTTHPVAPIVPTSPFEAVATDYFDLAGNHYLIVVDRLTNWADVRRAKPKTNEAGSQGLLDLFREVFRNYGVPAEISSDGGPEYTSNEFDTFLKNWGVRHRLSSAHHPSSNGRAEVAVKMVKRALRENCGPEGEVDNDKVTRALLNLRNTPDRDSGQSPAQLLLGRPLRDTLPLLQPWGRNQSPVHRGIGAQPIRSEWHDMWDEQEVALRHRLGKNMEKQEAKAHDLRPLELQEHVRVQNQTGNSPRRWERTGVVVGRNTKLGKYWVKMDGSRRVTERNRKFLRLFQPRKPPQVGSDVGGPGDGQALRSLTGTGASVDKEVQEQQRRDTPQQDARGGEARSPASPAGQAQLPASPARQAWSPATPPFTTPRTSPAAVTPARPATGRAVPRHVTFDLGQGEAPPPEMEDVVQPDPQVVAEPRAEAHVPVRQAQHVQPAPPAQTRPRRVTKMPARYADFDMSAEVSSSAEFGDNGLVGVWDVDKDDIMYRKEVTSQLASLAAMFENLLTAICG
jgi:hypothetical protein